jgi:16S rRNA processing protein RimM
VPKPPLDNPTHPCEAHSAEATQANRHHTHVLLGVLGRPHGVRGLVHVTSYTDPPEALARYSPLTDYHGRQFSLRWCGDNIAELTQLPDTKITDRTTAERLTNTRLYISRDQLPAAPNPDEFYIADLIGLTAIAPSGNPLGRITAVHDYGAGASLETETGLLVPFTRAAVPEIDFAAGRLTVSPPTFIDASAP